MKKVDIPNGKNRRVEERDRREAVRVNPKINFLKPQWIFNSCDEGSLCPTEDYQI
jgi:hypothetical protein